MNLIRACEKCGDNVLDIKSLKVLLLYKLENIVKKIQKTYMERSLKILYCPKCGSSNVEVRMWVNPNTKEIDDRCSENSEEDNWCKVCEEHVELLTLSQLWDNFSDIPINNDDEIESDFMGFEAGTCRFDIWSWFDERCPNNLHDDLMFREDDDE